MRVVVTGADQRLGAAVVAGLGATGSAVAAVDTVGARRDEVAATIETAIASLGGLDVLVVSGWHPPQLSPSTFEDITDDDFAAIWEGTMQGMLWTLQTAIPHLRESHGNVIVLMPTSGMTGAANYAAAAATFEAQRILMKAAARQLGPDDIRVNAIAVGAELVLHDPDAADVHYLAPPAVPGEQSADDVSGIVEFLVSTSGRHLSGQTITIDGGRWLAP